MASTWFESVAEAQRRARKRLPASVYGALLAGSELPARAIVERSLDIAADICIYTNRNLVIEELSGPPGRESK